MSWLRPARGDDPRIDILERSGFTCLSATCNPQVVYRCTQLRFALLCDTPGRLTSLLAQ